MVVTDVNKDGMLMGPNLDLIEKVLKKIKSPLIVSGGVSSLEDLHRLREFSTRYTHLKGVIVGKALYEGRFTLKEAIESAH